MVAGLGFVLGSILILLPFVVVGGKDFWVNNPWQLAFDFSGSSWPDTNFIFRALNQFSVEIGDSAMRWVKLVLTLSILVGVAGALHRIKVQHPFWHIALGAFLAHTLVWLPGQHSEDYALAYILPSFLAIASTRSSEMMKEHNDSNENQARAEFQI